MSYLRKSSNRDKLQLLSNGIRLFLVDAESNPCWKIKKYPKLCTANILLANVAGNAHHTLIHCLYIVYTLHVVQAMYKQSADITRTYSGYYSLYQRVLPTTCLYGTGNL